MVWVNPVPVGNEQLPPVGPPPGAYGSGAIGYSATGYSASAYGASAYGAPAQAVYSTPIQTGYGAAGNNNYNLGGGYDTAGDNTGDGYNIGDLGPLDYYRASDEMVNYTIPSPNTIDSNIANSNTAGGSTPAQPAYTPAQPACTPAQPLEPCTDTSFEESQKASYETPPQQDQVILPRPVPTVRTVPSPSTRVHKHKHHKHDGHGGHHGHHRKHR